MPFFALESIQKSAFIPAIRVRIRDTLQGQIRLRCQLSFWITFIHQSKALDPQRVHTLKSVHASGVSPSISVSDAIHIQSHGRCTCGTHLILLCIIIPCMYPDPRTLLHVALG